MCPSVITPGAGVCYLTILASTIQPDAHAIRDYSHNRLLHERERNDDAVQRDEKNPERLVVRFRAICTCRLKLEDEAQYKREKHLQGLDLRETVIDVFTERLRIRNQRKPRDAHRKRGDHLRGGARPEQDEGSGENHLAHCAAEFKPVSKWRHGSIAEDIVKT